MTEPSADYPAVRNIRRAAAILLLLVAVFAIGASWLSIRDEQVRQARTLTTLAEVGARSLESYLFSLQSALQFVSGDLLDEEERLDDRRTQAVFARLRAAYPELRILTLAQLDGTIIATTEGGANERGVAGRPATLAGQQTFVESRDERLRTGNRNLSMGRAFLGPRTGEWVIPLGYGIWGRKGDLRYVLGAGLPVSRPQVLWKDVPLPPDTGLGILRDDGYLMLRYPLPPTVNLADVYGRRGGGAMATHLAGGNAPSQGDFTAASRFTGEDTLFVYRRLSSLPLTFYVAYPLSNVRAEWFGRVWPVWLLLLMLMLAGYRAYRWTIARQGAWEDERARQVQMLRSANQALEDFAYTVAHDLKSPVRAIDGHAGIVLMKHGAGLEEGVRQRLEQIRRSAARMAGLIDDLLEFSRYSHATLDRRPVDMTALAREVAEDLAPKDAGVRLAIGEMPPCDADPVLMRVVWNSLLSNAVKYSARSTPPEIRVGYEDGAYFVSDNGVGFDMAHAGKLFGVFVRLHGDDEFEGTGAGLAITRRILERHGGHIAAEAVPGKGATFRFRVS